MKIKKTQSYEITEYRHFNKQGIPPENKLKFMILDRINLLS
ncbi:hypothetical protein XIS1_640002 [Xenorhabdus innexi]|uniref:Uncharacterized protein n=1 Tax=Xenorhabdus innexi TaxID=290109 RepID=A0A1N6N057_9GAMM|nr:hypothetical protein XIS1_640002 [Xenorhabdus innexi]